MKRIATMVVLLALLVSHQATATGKVEQILHNPLNAIQRSLDKTGKIVAESVGLTISLAELAVALVVLGDEFLILGRAIQGDPVAAAQVISGLYVTDQGYFWAQRDGAGVVQVREIPADLAASVLAFGIQVFRSGQ